MRKTVPGAAAIIMLVATPAASARGRFIAYEGNNALHTGAGGTSIARDGVEFWTNGTPARRFQILGTLQDTSDSTVTNAAPVGSASLARQARALGGDGLILASQNERSDGFTGGWSGGGVTGTRLTHTFAIAPLNWSVASETTVPSALILPPTAAGWVDVKVNVPVGPLATVLTGDAVLPNGSTWTVTWEPTREQVARYHAFGVTLIVEVVSTWPVEPRTRQDG